MPYIDTNTRTTATLPNESQKQLGRFNLLNGTYVGFIKDAVDVQRNGRLRVWIPELGTAPDEEQGWITVNYCSPFAGVTNIDTISKANLQQFEGTQTSYGMWMIPPDINNQVLVIFANGDTARGFWIGCVYNQYMNNMVPGMSASASNYQYPGKCVPVAEYNKWDIKTTQPDRTIKPYEKTKFQGLGNQGLITDCNRGITTSSARRESPSSVFGILTPGPPIASDSAPEQIRRKGGSAFIMDDEVGSEYIQLTTKTGAQIKIDETNGFVYLINRDGTAWVQMDKNGNIDIFGARDISMRAQRDFNIRADRNINIEAGQNLFMKAAKDTKEETTTFTYDVNNVPETKTIQVWNYKGEGNGDGGNLVMQALNNWHSTAQKNIYLTAIEDDFNINVGNNFNLQTMNGGVNFNSRQPIMMTTDGSVDIGATGNIRIGSKGTVSVIGIEGITLCSDSSFSLKAPSADIDATLTVSGVSNLTALQAVQASTLNSVSVPSPTINPAEPPMNSPPSRPAEIKPLNEKINILATWEDPESKFKRKSETLKTTTSRFPTYEPCPEHEGFNTAALSGYKPALTEADKTYEGSSGAGNDVKQAPPPAEVPGAENTSVSGDPPVDDTVSKDINLPALRHQLIVHEGLVKRSYLDSTNLLHGGIGHLLRTNEIPKYPLNTPISDEQIETWYSQDSTSAIRIAQDLIGSTWNNLTDVRKRSVIDLAFNLGRSRLSKFVGFLSNMKAGKYDMAGKELQHSIWYNQVGRRGRNIYVMVVQNVDPTVNIKQYIRS